MIYLASPYSHRSAKVRKSRYEAAMDACARLMADGAIVISPVVHSHPIALRHKLPKDWAFWRRIDIDVLRRADALVVLRIDGWLESVGVQEEIRIAKMLGIPITYMD